MKSGIIYKGPSQLDGKPIVVIATYSNRNTKTGAVVQTYILTPGESSRSQQDRPRLNHLRQLHHARHPNR